MGTPIRPGGRAISDRGGSDEVSDADFTPMTGGRPRSSAGGGPPVPGAPAAGQPAPRDNSSRFDD